MQDIKLREQIPLNQQWALEDMFSSQAAWEKEYKDIEEKLEMLLSYKGTLLERADNLYQCLLLEEELNERLDRIYSFANSQVDVDMENSESQKNIQRAASLLGKVASASSFISSEIVGIEEESLKAFKKELPELTRFNRTIEEILRDRPHLRSDEVEKVLADAYEMSKVTSDVFKMLANADIRFPQITDEEGNKTELTNARYMAFIESQDRNVRKEAFEALYTTYTKQKNTLAANYYGNVKQAIFFSKTRNFSSTRAYYLSNNRIPEEVYDNLIDSIHKGMYQLYRYMRLRKKLLGVSELHMYDVYAPLVSGGERKIPFEQAKEIVKAALKPMGEEYLSILQKGFDMRWIDYAENKGKRSGAYSNGVYGVHPYVLMTYKETLTDVFTLAHEMGHAIHSYYSNENQNYNNAGYRIFVAEVASTCNESLLNHYLSETAKDKKEKAFIINHFLERFRATVFRQTMFAEFEMLTHHQAKEGIPLTAEHLCQVYKELNRQYFGDEIILDQGIEMEWARIPHFYTPFYVYQYATGFSAATALAEGIIKNGRPAVDQYITFLRGGCTKDPIDLLRIAGVDMQKKEPVESAVNVFAGLLDELEMLIG